MSQECQSDWDFEPLTLFLWGDTTIHTFAVLLCTISEVTEGLVYTNYPFALCFFFCSQLRLNSALFVLSYFGRRTSAMFKCCIPLVVPQWEDDGGEFFMVFVEVAIMLAWIRAIPDLLWWFKSLPLLFQVWPAWQQDACHFLICATTCCLRLSQRITFKFTALWEWAGRNGSREGSTQCRAIWRQTGGETRSALLNKEKQSYHQHSSLLGNSSHSQFIWRKTNIRSRRWVCVSLAELPKPQLGEPRDLSTLRMQPVQDDVLTMSQTLDKLLARDVIQVELIPEKKGLFLKHVEYQVTSQARHRPMHAPNTCI